MKALLIGSKSLFLKVAQVLRDAGVLCGCVSFNDAGDTRSRYRDICIFCEENDISLYTPVTRTTFPDPLAHHSPDIVFVANWYWLIKPEVLRSVPLGFVGIHFSRLPKYRGNAPLVWTMINGENYAGYSWFKLGEGMDDGDVYVQGSVRISDLDYVQDVLGKLEERAVHGLRNILPKIIEGNAPGIRQDHLHASYGGARIPDDGVINWNMTVSQIYNFIRAQSDPYPGAFTWLEYKKVKIFRAHPFKYECFGSPGQVMMIHEGVPVVACGYSTGLVLEEVELDGRRMKAAEAGFNSRTRFRMDEATNWEGGLG